MLQIWSIAIFGYTFLGWWPLFYMFLIWLPICLYQKNFKKALLCNHYAPNTFQRAIHARETHLSGNLDSWPLISNFNKHFGAFLHAFFSSFASSSSCMKLRNHSWNKVIEVVEFWVKRGDKSPHLTFCRISLDKLSSAFFFCLFCWCKLSLAVGIMGCMGFVVQIIFAKKLPCTKLCSR